MGGTWILTELVAADEAALEVAALEAAEEVAAADVAAADDAAEAEAEAAAEAEVAALALADAEDETAAEDDSLGGLPAAPRAGWLSPPVIMLLSEVARFLTMRVRSSPWGRRGAGAKPLASAVVEAIVSARATYKTSVRASLLGLAINMVVCMLWLRVCANYMILGDARREGRAANSDKADGRLCWRLTVRCFGRGGEVEDMWMESVGKGTGKAKSKKEVGGRKREAKRGQHHQGEERGSKRGARGCGEKREERDADEQTRVGEEEERRETLTETAGGTDEPRNRESKRGEEGA